MPAMSKNLCRNFQQGSCRYGDRCKFLHTTPQNQNPNPFGFGVKNTPAPPPPNASGFKPFENKWVRPGQPPNQSQPAPSSQATHHQCTDPAVCKRLIAEDFRNEKPLWKLTCYGHFKQLPCDITGDISFEELRAEAYTDAKRGLSIQAIVEREKNLEKSKLIECENLIQNPYTKHAQSALSNHTSFPTVTTLPSQTPQNTGTSPFSGFSPQQGSSPNISFPIVSAASPSPTPQNTGPSLFSNLNPQQGPSPNMSFGVRPSTPTNTAFAQFQGTGPFGSANVRSGLFGTQAPAQTGQNSFPVQTSANPFSPNPVLFGNDRVNNQGNQAPVQIGGNSFSSNLPNFSTSGSQSTSLPSSFLLSPQQIQTPPISQPPVLSNGVRDTIAAQQSQIVQNEVLPADVSIWSKAEWKLGEIPEQPPPAEYVR